MRVLVVGSGGREAAMVWTLAQNPEIQTFCAPGNAGIAEYATCISVETIDIDRLLAFACNEDIDLTVVGPETPLVAGIVDRFRGEDLLICGPRAMAAQAEASKVWFKRLLAKYNIPTAPFEAFINPEDALTYIHERGAQNIVIKADGLMSGKGVTLPDSLKEAKRDLERITISSASEEAIIVEDRLSGVERSVTAVTDGKTVYMLPFTQDYKRESDGGKGPNTGGMGAHTISLSGNEKEQLSRILQDVVTALTEEGCPYSGFIYLGFMQTPDGPSVLECNCRLGDPEAQVILPSISGDFVELCMATARKDLSSVSPPIQQQNALCVVLASAEYPGSSDRNDVIFGIDNAQKDGAIVFHAGTARENGFVTSNKSGRVLNVIGVGNTFLSARRLAYVGVEQIQFPGMKYRKDIGAM